MPFRTRALRAPAKCHFAPGPGLVLTSDYRRARETAAPIAAALGVEPRLEPRLRERGFGPLDLQPVARYDEARGLRDCALLAIFRSSTGNSTLRKFFIAC